MRDTSNWAGTIARLGAKLLVALSLFVVVPTGARAQGIPYSFTRIADTLRNDAGLAGVHCVGMSGLGTVIVVFAPAGSSFYQLWRGDGQSFTQVDTSLASICASINDSDETAYLTPLSPGSSLVRLVKNSMGTLTTLARSDVTPFLYGPTTHLPSLSNSGSAVFMSAQGGGIAVGPAGPIVYDPSVGPPLNLISPVSMNDSLTVAFLALAAGRAGIYRGSAVPLIETGSVVAGGTVGVSLVRPVINNSGTVAFVGSVGGSERTPTPPRTVCPSASSVRIQLTDSLSTTQVRSRIGRTRREVAQRGRACTSANPDRSTNESLVLVTRSTARPSRPGICGRSHSTTMGRLPLGAACRRSLGRGPR